MTVFENAKEKLLTLVLKNIDLEAEFKEDVEILPNEYRSRT